MMTLAALIVALVALVWALVDRIWQLAVLAAAVILLALDATGHLHWAA